MVFNDREKERGRGGEREREGPQTGMFALVREEKMEEKDDVFPLFFYILCLSACLSAFVRS